MHTFYHPISYSAHSYINPCCYLLNNCSPCNRRPNHIPIKVDIRPYVLPNSWQDPSDLPGMSGDRYFLKVFSPYIDNSLGTPRDTPHNHIKVDKYGIYSNMVLLGLLPSPCHSIKGCYRVEYWRWNKLITTPGTDLGCRVECGVIRPITETHPSSQLLKSEWWYIGSRTNRCNTNTKTVPMVRKDNDLLPTPNNVDYLPINTSEDILVVDDITGIPNEYESDWRLVTDEVKGPYHPQIKERVVTSLGIKWGIGPRAGTPYTLKYKTPLTLEDIIYRPTRVEQELLNIRTY